MLLNGSLKYLAHKRTFFMLLKNFEWCKYVNMSLIKLDVKDIYG